MSGPHQPFDAVRLGARVAACDVMNYVNDAITVTGVIDGHRLRSFLFHYWLNAGGFEGEELVSGEG
jgi:hypothetical protein